tara:strand:- start:142 stop:543 length:402 start_codon:yes stop_codon:yes gene_type:complete
MSLPFVDFLERVGYGFNKCILEDEQMTSFARTTEIFAAEKWDPVAFKNCFHEEFMFVRETDLVTRDEFCASIGELMEQGKLDWQNIELVHENNHVMETKWIDGDELVVRVNLKKDGLTWRSIVKRSPIPTRLR